MRTSEVANRSYVHVGQHRPLCEREHADVQRDPNRRISTSTPRQLGEKRRLYKQFAID